MTDESLTDVIFRAWRKDGDVIALFPGLAGDSHPATCSSYMHVGQHGGANVQAVMLYTRPATVREYADLKRELESAPFKYRFRIVKRATKAHLKEREAQLTRVA